MTTAVPTSTAELVEFKTLISPAETERFTVVPPPFMEMMSPSSACLFSPPTIMRISPALLSQMNLAEESSGISRVTSPALTSTLHSSLSSANWSLALPAETSALPLPVSP